MKITKRKIIKKNNESFLNNFFWYYTKNSNEYNKENYLQIKEDDKINLLDWKKSLIRKINKEGKVIKDNHIKEAKKINDDDHYNHKEDSANKTREKEEDDSIKPNYENCYIF